MGPLIHFIYQLTLTGSNWKLMGAFTFQRMLTCIVPTFLQQFEEDYFGLWHSGSLDLENESSFRRKMVKNFVWQRNVHYCKVLDGDTTSGLIYILSYALQEIVIFAACQMLFYFNEERLEKKIAEIHVFIVSCSHVDLPSVFPWAYSQWARART